MLIKNAYYRVFRQQQHDTLQTKEVQCDGVSKFYFLLVDLSTVHDAPTEHAVLHILNVEVSLKV